MPATKPVKFAAAVNVPLHTTWSATWVAVGVGLTVMEKVLVAPLHVFEAGVTVMKAVTGILPAFVALNAAILPAPDDARPMLDAVLVQL